MRSIFVVLTTSVATLILGPAVIIARLLHLPQGPGSVFARCIRLWARTIMWASGVEVVVHNAERMEQADGAVFVANHNSWFDIFALASVVPWCTFVAKSELRKIPLFGFAAECVGIVFVERENRKQAFASYELAAKEVRRGRAIVVCPEGTRGLDYRLRPFKKGPFVLAIASQSPIVPTIVHGTIEVMPKGTFRVRKGRVDLHFLEPVPTAGYDYDERTELMTRTWTRMADAIEANYGVHTSEHPVSG